MKPIDPEGFERLFQSSIDPWNYTGSRFEAFKRGVLLRACGDRCHGRGLELACANGETTRRLHGRCLRLTAVDASPTAVKAAARRTRCLATVSVACRLLPQEMPRGRFDLIVVSELVYYLSRNDLRGLLARIEAALAPGGRVVVLHHVRAFDDAAQLPSLAQAAVCRHLSHTMRRVFDERHGRFHAAAFVAPQRPRRRRV